MRRIVVLGLAAVLLAAVQPVASAATERVRHGEVDGLPYTVVLPTGYDESTARHPVLYLIHPGGSTAKDWLERTDLLEFTASRDVIVVLPDPGGLGLLIDAADGSCRGESQLLEGLIPHIDGRYRTVADGRHRAIAGASTSANAAMLLAARYPDRFAAAGSLDGPPDLSLGLGRAGLALWLPVERFAVATDCGGNPAGPGLYGDLVTDELFWHDANPADLAANLRGLGLYVSVGNGVPCDLADVAGLAESQQTGIPGSQLLQLSGPYEGTSSRAFTEVLAREQIGYDGDVDRCGLHSWRYWQLELHEFWPVLERAFGSPAPAEFDHRRATPLFAAWGWSFAADPGRAAEFLQVSDASRGGFTLTGSGRTTVITAAYYHPHQSLLVDGRERAADAAGRLRLVVDLGPPHTVQQYRIGSAPGDFTTRTVTVRPS